MNNLYESISMQKYCASINELEIELHTPMWLHLSIKKAFSFFLWACPYPVSNAFMLSSVLVLVYFHSQAILRLHLLMYSRNQKFTYIK